jgi:EAL domain-containing protein (putative c-di-GMP-specific phosphodiesterase class I)
VLGRDFVPVHPRDSGVSGIGGNGLHHGRDEPQTGRTTIAELSEQTAKLLGELAGCETDAAATHLALQRASEAVDADLCVYVDGDLTESATSQPSLVVPIHGRLRGHLVLARGSGGFDQTDREQIKAIARALSLFEPGRGPELLDRLALQDELAAALSNGEIQTYFLPRVDLRTARVTGVEALARWFHPDRGILPPADFLGPADSGGLMSALTKRVIDIATRATADWWRSGLRLELSVNLAARALEEPDPELQEFIQTALSRSGLPTDALRFDVTEDAVMTAADPTGALEDLTMTGASISIDDFGTGHTSLGRLKRLAVDELKIDRSFIRALSRGGDRALVRSTIHLARQMGLRVVAEGVETEDTWRQLRGMGCDAAQGFLIAAPMPSRELLAWLAAWDARGRELNTIQREQLEVPKPRPRKRSHARDKAPA